MDTATINALIGAGGSVIVAVTALLLNYRGFNAIDSRFASLESSMNSRFTSVENRLNILQSDLKDFNKTLTAIEIDVAKVKDKVGL
jgi:hypothetical protein